MRAAFQWAVPCFSGNGPNNSSRDSRSIALRLMLPLSSGVSPLWSDWSGLPQWCSEFHSFACRWHSLSRCSAHHSGSGSKLQHPSSHTAITDPWSGVTWSASQRSLPPAMLSPSLRRSGAGRCLTTPQETSRQPRASDAFALSNRASAGRPNRRRFAARLNSGVSLRRAVHRHSDAQDHLPRLRPRASSRWRWVVLQATAARKLPFKDARGGGSD